MHSVFKIPFLVGVLGLLMGGQAFAHGQSGFADAGDGQHRGCFAC
jgi:hypothetical protein